MSRAAQQSVVRALEERLLAPEGRRDIAELERRIARDFVEVGASGRVYDRAAVIASLLAEPRTEPHPERAASNFEFRWLSDELVLLIYRLVQTEPRGTVACTMRSSLWTRVSGDWQMAFHQGTPVDSP